MNSSFELKITGVDTPPAPYTEGVKHAKNILKPSVIDGLLTDQFNKLVAKDEDIGTSATLTIDLQTDLDRYGVALALADVALLYIEHKDTSAASEIQVQANAANGFTNLMGTAAAVKLAPGDFILVGALIAGNLASDGTNKALDIVNQDGSNVAGVIVHLWGRG